MKYRGVLALAVILSSSAAIAGARCLAPEWYQVVLWIAALATGVVLALFLATADPKLASEAMTNVRAAQENLRGFLEYRGLSTGITPITSTSGSLLDALSSPVALIVLFALAVLFSVMNGEHLVVSCADLAPRSWGFVVGEFAVCTCLGQGIVLVCWRLVEARRKR